MPDITCPHCQYPYDTEDMLQSDNNFWDAAHSEEPLDEKCCSCGKVFFVSCSWLPEFKTFKTEDDRDYS